MTPPPTTTYCARVGRSELDAASAALAAAGLKEGDYTIDQLDMAQHVNVMQAGTFDAGYPGTLVAGDPLYWPSFVGAALIVAARSPAFRAFGLPP